MHRLRTTATAGVLALTLTIGVAACSSDGGSEGGSPATTAASGAADDAPTTSVMPTTTASADDAEATDAVDISDFAFDPVAITVEAGTTVTWTNSDTAPHSAESTSGAPEEFDTGDLGPGESATVTFDEPGTYPYQCGIHNYMKGTVVVTG